MAAVVARATIGTRSTFTFDPLIVSINVGEVVQKVNPPKAALGYAGSDTSDRPPPPGCKSLGTRGVFAPILGGIWVIRFGDRRREFREHQDNAALLRMMAGDADATKD